MLDPFQVLSPTRTCSGRSFQERTTSPLFENYVEATNTLFGVVYVWMVLKTISSQTAYDSGLI